MSDNEMDDIWERIDLVADEVGGDLAKIERCRNARRKGVGGGHGGAAASLSNTLQNLSKGAGAAGAGAPPAVAGVPRESDVNGYKWNQTDEDVQIRFAVPVVKAKFGYKSLKVTVADQTLCDGDMFNVGRCCCGQIYIYNSRCSQFRRERTVYIVGQEGRRGNLELWCNE